MKYSEAIKKLRLIMCLTQTEFRALFGISYITVNRWESGKYEPTMRIKRKMKDFFEKEDIKLEVDE